MTPVRRRFSVEEFHRMAQAGLLGEDDRVELLEGEIWQMSPIGSRHAACLRRLRRLFTPLETQGLCLLAVQDPLRLSPHSEPQPDLLLLKPREDLYAEAHPGPEDVLLLVEVADASGTYDREVKVWVVDLAEGKVHRFLDPSPGGYREHHVLGPESILSPTAFPEFPVPVASLL